MVGELLDVVDDEDHVVGRASRAEIHRRHLTHRSAHVFLFRCNGDLALQLRSASKDVQPGLYDSSAAGHVAVGEDYRSCAVRELWEELGIEVTLDEEIASFPACAQTGWEHVHLYVASTEAEPIPNRDEVDEILWLPLDAIQDMLDREPHRFTSDFRFLFRWYQQWRDR